MPGASDYDIQLALEISDFRVEKAIRIMAMPLFKVARGDEANVSRRLDL